MNKSVRVSWIFNSMGYNNRLLYWEPILKEFVREFPKTRFLTCETDSQIAGTDHRVEKLISFIRIGYGKNKLTVPSPLMFITLRRIRPALIVISEFGLLSFFAAIYRLLNNKCRLLLLVENDPAYLNFYGTRRKSFYFDILRRIIGSMADLVLTNNANGAEYLQTRLKLPPKKILNGCYLTSSIRIQFRKNRKIYSSPDTLKLLYVGQLIKRKGLGYLIAAIDHISAELRQRIRLDIVGDGPERESLGTLVSELGLEKFVIFHGAVEYYELEKYFGHNDVFVLPTLGDYRSLVSFEALSAGLPIIGSIFDGASVETIEEGVNGFVVNPIDVKTLSSKIMYFLDNPESVAEFGRASMRRSAQFDPMHSARILIGACQNCIG